MSEAYGPVMQALTEHINQSQYGRDMSDLLSVKVTGPPALSGVRESDYMPRPDYAGGELNITKSLSLPPELVERFAKMKSYCIMGLFREVERVWLTIDNVIYMWNYENGNDLAYYDGIEQVITCLGFVKPIPGILSPSIAYLLCVVTPAEIIILGIRLERDEIHFLSQPIARINDINRTFTVIQGSQDGRIFLGTADNSVLEVTYAPYMRWSVMNYLTTPRAHTVTWKLVNHTSSILGSYVPNLFKLSDDESITQMCIDPHRHKCYTLTDKATLTMYNLGTHEMGEQSFTREDVLSAQQIMQAASNAGRGSIERIQFQNIAHMSYLDPGPGPLHLLLVANTGTRFYLTSMDSRLRLLHVRLPPPGDHQRSLGSMLDVKLCAVSRGTALFLARRGEENDLLFVVSPDPFPGSSSLIETVTYSWPPSRAWSLMPIGEGHEFTPQYYKDTLSTRSGSDGTLSSLRKPLSAYQTQHIDPVRRFLLVSAQGLVHLELPSPIQRLKELFIKAHTAENEAVKNWYAHFGPEEGAYASLILSSEESLTGHVAEIAVQAIYLYCCPMPSTSANPQSIMNRSLPNTLRDQQMVAPSTVYFLSMPPVLHGIFLYLGRIIFPLWNNAMVEERRSNNQGPPNNNQLGAPATQHFIRFDADELQWFLHHVRHLQDILFTQRQQLQQVIRTWCVNAGQRSSMTTSTPAGGGGTGLLSRTPPRFMMASPPKSNSTPRDASYFGSHAVNGVVSAMTGSVNSPGISLPAEDLLLMLPVFLDSLQEMLSFWKILVCHNFPLLCRKLSANHLGQLRQTSMSHLLQFNVDSRSLVNGLITALLDTFLLDDANIEAISLRLLTECPTLFAKEDAACAKANELVTKAANIHVPREYSVLTISYEHESLLSSISPSQRDEIRLALLHRHQLLQQAIDLYCEAGANVDLGLILPRLINVGYYSGIVRLCLVVAQQRDPECVARHFYLQDRSTFPLDGMDDIQVDWRRDAYQHMLRALDYLHSVAYSEATATSFICSSDNKQSHDETPTPKSASEAGVIKRFMHMAQRELNVVLARVFDQCDEIMVHFELISWMLSKGGMEEAFLHGLTLDGNLRNELSGNYRGCSSHLETFLRIRIRQFPDEVLIRDLLWRYYELMGQRIDAAHVLDDLAVSPNPNVPLSNREEYLGRAVLMLKVYGTQDGSNEYLYELEDKLDMCKIQAQMIKEIHNAYGSGDNETSKLMEGLETALYPASRLYEFACDFDLPLSQLLLLKASLIGSSPPTPAFHENQMVVTGMLKNGTMNTADVDESIVADCWRRLLHRELRGRGGDAGEEVALLDRTADLLLLFKNVQQLFPIILITSSLELHASDRGYDVMWTSNCLQKAGLPLSLIIDAYDSLLRSKHFIGSEQSIRDRVYSILYFLIDSALTEADRCPDYKRKALYSQYEDPVNTYLIDVKTKHGALSMKESELSQKFKHLLARIERVT